MRAKPLTNRRGEVRELTQEDLRRFKPAAEMLPKDLLSALPKRKRGQRGTQRSPTKQQVTLRLDRDVVAHYKATGPGWQTRINKRLREGIG